MLKVLTSLLWFHDVGLRLLGAATREGPLLYPYKGSNERDITVVAMFSRPYLVTVVPSIFILSISCALSGQNVTQRADPPPCTNTTKSYPEPVCLSDLAHVYMEQHQYDQAEPILKRELRVREKAVGPNDPDLVNTIDRLALLYQTESNYSEAESLFRRGLAIRVKAFGIDNLKVAESTQALADLYRAQKRDAEAEDLLKQTIGIEEKVLRPSDSAYPTIAWTLTDLGSLYEGEKKYAQAEPVLTRALTIYQSAASPNYFNIGDSLFEVAIVFAMEGKNRESESYFKQTLATMEKSLGPEHPHLAPVLEMYSGLLQRLNRVAEAEEMKTRANTIRMKTKH